jgi:hypothetical protein
MLLRALLLLGLLSHSTYQAHMEFVVRTLHYLFFIITHLCSMVAPRFLSIIVIIAEVTKLLVRVTCVDYKIELFRCFVQQVLCFHVFGNDLVHTCQQTLSHSSGVIMEHFSCASLFIIYM